MILSAANNQFKAEDCNAFHKPDGFHHQNSFCKKCSEHLLDFSRMRKPFLAFTHVYMRIKIELCKFKENRFIIRWLEHS